MLTADLVRARRRGDRLYVSALSAKKRADALETSARLLDAATAHIGEARESFEQVCKAIVAQAGDRKLAAGLRKLVEDRCEFERPIAGGAAALRKEVFAHAHARRLAGEFERAEVLFEIAALRGISSEELERALYADLRAAHTLLAFDSIGVEGLVALYERQRQQAVLLRATRVSVEFDCRDPRTLRALFHRLKFLQLLFTLEGRGPGRYALELDGPLSLFSASTRYGLKLALALDALRACERFRLEAQLLWGKERRHLRYELEERRSGGAKLVEPHLPEPVEALLDRFEARQSAWRVRASDAVLDLPGVGMVIPDLTFERDDGAVVHLEVLGFWSREAVFRRVDLVRSGLPHRLLFAVSERLRVSEALLEEDDNAALLVFKGLLRPKAVERKLEALVGRASKKK